VANFRKKLIVKPHGKVKLRELDPAFHGHYASPDEALPETEDYLKKMSERQLLMYSENRHSLLIVLQGMDSAGKDGLIRKVLTGINPQGCWVKSFKEPTSDELAHDFLWRVHPHTPARGMVAVFNRSHYEDVLITRVHGLVSPKRCEERYQRINEFEKLLIEENSTTVLKFFLHISKGEQLERFKKRLNEPSHRWKISVSDYKERKYWKGYQEAYEELLCHTSTERAPWFVIPANHKWFRDLAVSQIIAEALENLKMKAPKPSVNISKIKRKLSVLSG
jgi:PPK2 family polyphosphate:nucleotide phosphotransferase